MNRANEALVQVEPIHIEPEEWQTILDGELGKHLFRWYIEENLALSELSDRLEISIGGLKLLFDKYEIKVKDEFDDKFRPHRLDGYLRKALITSERTSCLKGGTGAVIINIRRRDVLYGFNGAPRGDFHCTDVGTCKKDIYGYGPGEGYEICVAVHAEQSVICEAAASGIKTEGCTILVTRKPCAICYRLIRMAKFSIVIYPDPETNVLMGEDLKNGKSLFKHEVYELFS